MSERKRIARIFKMRGLSIQSTALDALLNVLRRERSSSSSQRDSRSDNDTLFAIIDEIKDRMLLQTDGGGDGASRRRRSSSRAAANNVVTTSLLEEVVAELSRDAKDVTDEALQMLDAFGMPRLEFDAMRKQFGLNNAGTQEGGRMLCGEAVDKVDMFAQRYALIQQRILRQDIFQPKLVTAAGTMRSNRGGGTHTLTPVESLLGRGGVRYLA